MKFKRLRKFREGTEGNPRFKCMEDYDYSDDIVEFRKDVINALDQFYDGKYYVGTGIDDKSILVTDVHDGIDYKIDISVST